MTKRPRHPVQTPPKSPSVPQPPLTQQAVEFRAEWKGPLPPPSALQGYNEVGEGYADRIMDAFEEEGNHRRRRENRDQLFIFLLDGMGLLSSGGICAMALYFGYSLLMAGHELGGFTAMIGALVPLTGALYIARRRKAPARSQ